MTFQPTGSSSAGLITGIPVAVAGQAGVARAAATEAHGGEAAIGISLEVGGQWPARAVAARAVDVQLEAVVADVAYCLEWKPTEHACDVEGARSLFIGRQ